ncbi:MAG: response regulator [Planctomycetota bacterium]|nr:response regulator [Planctomycetota bacterium]MDA1138353.1 response regulator [Planctomycetota bacterium]
MTLPRKIRALIADDSPSDVDLTMLAFEDAGIDIDIDVVTDGEQAMDFLRRNGKYAKAERPDLILLDLNMPRLTGLEVLARLMKDDSLKKIPVVVLSTSETSEDIELAYSNGANAYITKPVDYREFIQVVKAIHEFWFRVAKLPSPSAQTPEQ